MVRTHQVQDVRNQDSSILLATHWHVRVLESPKTWSLETLNNIRSWLQSCRSTHDRCNKVKAGSRLPLRLIDVMSTELIQNQPPDEIDQETFNLLSLEHLHNVHIVSTLNSLPQETPYLTLSHRWGNPPSILLQKTTSYLLSDDISPHLLGCAEAAVFRHAVHVTRALGFRYIWIDALCITQDDEVEKTTEIMHMDEIYFNSMLNISATEGQAREGLVFDRKVHGTNPYRAIVRVPEVQEEMHLQAFHEKWFLQLTEGPLNQRGWVFQERMLATRIVHFTKDQVFWECHSLMASEILPEGMPQDKDSEQRYLSRDVGINSTNSDMQEVKIQWYDLIETYSRTSLSFPDDHLLAISAVAKRFCSTMRLEPSDYLAGMWKDDLPLSLLWNQDPLPGRVGPESISIGREFKHAPSWSWASIMAPLEIVGFYNLIPTAEVVHVQIMRRSPNFFDGSDSCRLRLRGPVCKVHRKVQDGVPWIHAGQQTRLQELDEFRQSYFKRDLALTINWDTSRRIVAANKFFLLLLAVDDDDENEAMNYGIILLRIENSATYVRVGYFSVVGIEYPGSELSKAFGGLLNTADPDDYLELDSSGKHTFDII